MNKLLDSNYWMFRVVIPGVWCCVITIFLLRIFKINFIGEHLSGIQVATAISGFGIACGLLFHYVINYPRRRKRFKDIEKQYGPIHHILDACDNCDRPCTVSKSYEGISHTYFGILNNDMPAGTRNMVYYFSSVYLLFAHIAFISVIMVVLSLGFLGWKVVFVRDLSAVVWTLIFAVTLLTVFVLLNRKNSPPEKYLVRMFEMQTEWLKANNDILKKRVCDCFEHKVQP